MTMKSKSSQYPFIIPLRSWHSVSTILEHVNKGNRKHYCPYGMKNPHLSIHFHCLTFDQPHLLHILSACNFSASSTSHESIFTYLLSNQAYKSLYALRVIDLFHLRRTSLITFSLIRRVIQKHLVSSRLFAASTLFLSQLPPLRPPLCLRWSRPTRRHSALSASALTCHYSAVADLLQITSSAHNVVHLCAPTSLLISQKILQLAYRHIVSHIFPYLT